MQRFIDPVHKQEAVDELKEFYRLTAEELYTAGWDWHLALPSEDTESIRTLRTCGRDIPISRQGCNQTVYDSVPTNLLARFWHDVMHITLGKNFTFEQEVEVIRSQLMVLQSKGLSGLAQEIFWADWYGQSLYYEHKGEFVKNQNAFMDSCLRHGIEIACKAKH